MNWSDIQAVCIGQRVLDRSLQMLDAVERLRVEKQVSRTRLLTRLTVS